MHGEEVAGILQGTYSKYFGFGMTLGVMRGPLVNLKDEIFTQAVETLLKALEEYAKRNRIIEGRILVPQAWDVDKIFSSMGYSLVGMLNEYVVNLENGVDTLWKGISHNKRRNIKKALNKGVEVFESREREDLLTFYSMLRAAEERAGFSSYPLSWFETVWDIYQKTFQKFFS
jgi:hypothetical protein